jgi:glycosyltransferase involved in cell wall biosynthesis
MHILLVHQNFPGQFRELAPAWSDQGHRLTAVGSAVRSSCSSPEHPGLRCFPYACPSHHWRPQVLANHLRRLIQEEQLHPDLVIAHSGWGEAIPIKDIWPQTPLVVYPELWGSPLALGDGFDPQQMPLAAAQKREICLQNRRSAYALQHADAAVAPTAHQRDSFPSPWRERIQVIHEGVNCDQLQPDPSASLLLPHGLLLDRWDRVITYVSRQFEPLRGLRTFMAALPPLLAQDPLLQVVMVGGAAPGYGLHATHPDGHLAQELARLPADLDHSRLHRLGPLPYNQLRSLLQLSTAHVYLTYPYTLSWSVLEAMACGAPVVGNHSGPLDEVITDGENGLLVDFNSADQLVEALTRLLADPPLRQRLGLAGRRTVQERFSLTLALERYEALFRELSAAAG